MPFLLTQFSEVCCGGILACTLLAAPMFGQEKSAAEPKKAKDSGESKENKSDSDKKAPKKETIVTTKHSIVIDGKTVAYEAMAGKLPIKDAISPPW